MRKVFCLLIVSHIYVAEDIFKFSRAISIEKFLPPHVWRGQDSNLQEPLLLSIALVTAYLYYTLQFIACQVSRLASFSNICH